MILMAIFKKSRKPNKEEKSEIFPFTDATITMIIYGKHKESFIDE